MSEPLTINDFLKEVQDMDVRFPIVFVNDDGMEEALTSDSIISVEDGRLLIQVAAWHGMPAPGARGTF